MNYTKSGIIATGAPFSRARSLGEAKLAYETPALLLLTDEGNEIANRFFRSIGCDGERMTVELKAELLANDERFFPFICGVIFGLEK